MYHVTCCCSASWSVVQPTLKLLSCVYARCPYVDRNMVSGVGFRPNCRGLLPSFEVSNSNASSVIGRLTEVYSLRSSCVWIVASCIRSIMAAVSTTAKIPLPLNLSDRLHQGENWKSFRREWKFYELAAGIHKKAQEVRVASLLNVIGKEGMDMYETFQWQNSSDALKIDKVLEKFEERCVPVRNETYERYIFFKRD